MTRSLVRTRRKKMAIDFSVISNKDELQELIENAMERALSVCGMVAETHAKEVLTETVYSQMNLPYKLTGRLRNSIAHAVKDDEGKTFSYHDDQGNGFLDTIGGGLDKYEVAIGTNVVYAAGVEYGTHRKAGAVHFIQRAISEHGSEYKKLVKDSLENA